ncbi:hypothetical protein [Pseudoalteromonas marina]|uniref:hypothetical protein n=1 Tax=Pseudoalteromonas marina TaxID=267375 RepID=UPI0023F0F6B9|nr:hypothetical protein [Pseudoalteromonas marina]
MNNSSYYALQQFGAAFMGPAFNGYARAVHSFVDKNDQIIPVCLAREGWSINRLLTRTANVLDGSLQKPVYLKVSRTILFKSLLGDEIIYDVALKNEFKGSIMDLLIKRFGLTFDDVFQRFAPETFSAAVSLPDDKAHVEDILRNTATSLRDLVAPTRKALLNYLKSQGLTDKRKTALMLDLGYSGTIQKLITYLLNQDTEGLYFIANKSGINEVDSNTANMKGVFFNDVKWGEGCLMLERSLFFESIMTAPHGQVIDIREMADGSFEFFYGRETTSQDRFQDLKAVIDGGIWAAREGLKNDVTYTAKEVSELYSVYAKTPGAIPASVSHLFSVEDDFSGLGIVNAKQMFSI